jgi:methyl-accepting chemotaxis protein
MIHAFHGDVERIETYDATFNHSYDAVLGYLDEYLEKSEGHPMISDGIKGDIRSTVTEMKSLLSDYRTLLFEPNVIFAKAGDVESLMPTSVQYGPLILAVDEHINNLVEQELQIQETNFGITKNAVTRTTILTYVVIFLAITAAVILSVYLYRQVGLPLHDYTDWMRFTAKGDVSWDAEELAILDKFKGRRDEIGVLFECYADLCAYIQQKCDELAAVSQGDLTVEVIPNSDTDLLAIAAKNMVEKLNVMFAEINSTSMQIENNAGQLNQGTNILADGSAEQAATVEQLSASVNAIAEKTESNASLAGKAAALASTIKSNAERGSRQMDEMMTAVNEINQASQSIGKVIKVIDDIAFQTNILALNAAVEAARAGQHGKGFAVVAEEVRNLAAKSAEAAKDTGGLIENSMEKARQGTDIAEETASSLADIVSGINESSMLIGEIARSSEGQSTSINQINLSIDHVSQTVSENSATAEEISTISEELNNKAKFLEELVAQFKLGRR